MRFLRLSRWLTYLRWTWHPCWGSCCFTGSASDYTTILVFFDWDSYFKWFVGRVFLRIHRRVDFNSALTAGCGGRLKYCLALYFLPLRKPEFYVGGSFNVLCMHSRQLIFEMKQFSKPRQNSSFWTKKMHVRLDHWRSIRVKMTVDRAGSWMSWVFTIHSWENGENFIFVDLADVEIKVELFSELTSTWADEDG